jgi:hypothetical protein
LAILLVAALGLWAPTPAGAQNHTRAKVPAARGEQAPPANPGQRNFGGPIPPGGAGAQAPPVRPPRPEPKIGTVSLDQISMSDPSSSRGEAAHVWHRRRLYKSTDLKMWTGPYPIIDLNGTWMDGHFVAAAEIHHIGGRYYLAGTWNDHSHPIENIPRRYNVPTNQTQLLVADSPKARTPWCLEFDFASSAGLGHHRGALEGGTTTWSSSTVDPAIDGTTVPL